MCSSSLHKEACSIWLMDPAIFHPQKAFKNFVLLTGSENKRPSCLCWFSSDVMGLTCGVWGGVVTPQLCFCLPHFALIDAHTQNPFYETFLCRLLQCSQIWQWSFFLLEAETRVRDWDALFVFTLRFMATMEARFGWMRCRQGALCEQCSVQVFTYPGTIYSSCCFLYDIFVLTCWTHGGNQTNTASYLFNKNK